MRVNMDSSIVTEPSFKRVAKTLGVSWREVIGSCFLVWVAAYERRSERMSRMDIDIAAELDGFADALVAHDLAHEIDEHDVHLRGVAKRIEFLERQAERGAKGGRNRGKRRLADAKRVLSERSSARTDTAQAYSLTLTPALDQDLDPPPAGDPESESGGDPGRGGVPTAADLKAVYALYPRKVGGTEGLKKLRTRVKTPGDYAQLVASVSRMAELWAGEDTKYCPHWITYVNGDRWRDDEQPGPRPNGSNGNGKHQRGLDSDDELDAANARGRR